MKKKILVALHDPGSANSLSGVLNIFNKDSRLELIALSGSQYSEDMFSRNSIPYKKLENLKPEDAEGIVKYEKPDLVITGISVQSNLDRYFIYAAKANNRDSVALFEGYTYSTVKLKDSNIDSKYKFRPDYLLVLDKIAKNVLSRDFEEEKLIITGNPADDELFKIKQKFTLEEAVKVRRDLNINETDYLISFLSQPLYEDNLGHFGYTQVTVLRDLEDALAKLNLSNLFLLVKLHPREEPEKSGLVEFGKKLKGFLFDKTYDTKKVILASDLVTGMVTNGLRDAVYLDKDVISLQSGLIPGREDRFPLNEIGLTVPVYDKKEIVPTLKKVIYDREFKQNLMEKRKNLILDGKAAERVINFIYKLIKI